MGTALSCRKGTLNQAIAEMPIQFMSVIIPYSVLPHNTPRKR